jgi:hypothetical protein
MGDEKRAQNFYWKYRKNRTLEIAKRKRKNNMKIDLTERGLGVWIRICWLRTLVPDFCENGNERSRNIKGGQCLHLLSAVLSALVHEVSCCCC